MLTFSSLLRALVIESRKLSIALVASDFDSPAEDATAVSYTHLRAHETG